MGIDIYLNGYDAFEERSKDAHAAFKAAVAERDQWPAGKAHDLAQVKVDDAYEARWSGANGYLRSSYNSAGLFNVLEEIFGFSMAAYLFPGDWESDQPIDGAEFICKVENLQRTIILAAQRSPGQLPFTEYFTEVTGERAPDPHATHVHGEEFGASVLSMLSKMAPDGSIEPAARDAHKYLNEDHRWYLTEGIQDLLDFGALAKRLNDAGTPTFVHISY